MRNLTRAVVAAGLGPSVRAWRSPPALLALLAALAVGTPSAKEADDPLPWQAPAQRAQCPDRTGHLWLPHPLGDHCLRYFSADSLQHAPTVIVHFTGDRDQALALPADQIAHNTAQAQRARTAVWSRQAGVPVVMLARPGTYGSSGDHRRRRRLTEEYAPLNAALDALRQRYQIGQFVLWGHSGGATAAAAMLTLGRTDVRCAVLSSATFDYAARWAWQRARGWPAPDEARAQALASEMYDPLAHVHHIHADAQRIVHLIGHPQDNITPFEFQARFAQALEQAGHAAQLHQADAAPPRFHDLRGNPGLRLASACAREPRER